MSGSTRREEQGEGRTLCVSNLPGDVTERELLTLFNRAAEFGDGVAVAVDAKVARNPEKNEECVGYAHVEFCSHDEAMKAYDNAERQGGLRLLGRARFAYLHWAKRPTSPPSIDSFQLYIAGIDPEFTDSDLLAYIRGFNDHATRAKVVRDKITRISRGFGFVLFTTDVEAKAAIKAIRLSIKALYIDDQKNLKQPSESQLPCVPRMLVRNAYRLEEDANANHSAPVKPRGEKQHQRSAVSAVAAANTTVFVGNLSPSVSEVDLTTLFSPFGSVISVRIAFLKHIAFIKFAEHVSALAAISHLNQQMFKAQRLGLSWGRTRHPLPPSQRLESIVDHPYLLDEERSYSLSWHQAMQPIVPPRVSSREEQQHSAVATGVGPPDGGRQVKRCCPGAESVSSSEKEEATVGSKDMAYWLSCIAGGGLGDSAPPPPSKHQRKEVLPPESGRGEAAAVADEGNGRSDQGSAAGGGDEGNWDIQGSAAGGGDEPCEASKAVVGGRDSTSPSSSVEEGASAVVSLQDDARSSRGQEGVLPAEGCTAEAFAIAATYCYRP